MVTTDPVLAIDPVITPIVRCYVKLQDAPMAIERNLQWFRYVSDGGTNFGIMADQDWGVTPGSGLAAFNSADPAFGPMSKQHTVRKAVYIDPVTFRTVTHPVGTAAAFAALPATISVPMPGSATAATYNLKRRVPEKIRIPGPTRNLADRP